MILYEVDARKKWCPHAMELVSDRLVANRDADGVPMEGMCLGSLCMAWRWHNELTVQGTQTHEGVARLQTVVQRKGFCGLAGRP